MDKKDKSSIGVGFYKNSLSTNKLGKYMRPKSRLVKLGEIDEYNPPAKISSGINGQAQVVRSQSMGQLRSHHSKEGSQN